jgi:hypothetical protein
MCANRAFLAEGGRAYLTDLPFLDSVHLATLAVLDAIQSNLLEALLTARTAPIREKLNWIEHRVL